MRAFFPCVIAYTLTACSGGVDNSSPEFDPDVPGVSIRATAEIATFEKTQRVAFLPNPVETENSSFFLNLPGQVILLSDSGHLWVTTTESEPPAKMSDQTFTDVSAFITAQGEGYVLSKSKSNALSVFTRSTTHDTLERATLSYGGEPVERFCQSGAYFISADNHLHKFIGATLPSGVVELSSEPSSLAVTDFTDCYADDMKFLTQSGNTKRAKDWFVFRAGRPEKIERSTGLINLSPISDTVFLALTAQTGQPVVVENKTVSKLSVDDGLSIRGLAKADFIAVTPRAMGTTFSDGLILLGDHEENRIVMISLEYAQRELSPKAPE